MLKKVIVAQNTFDPNTWEEFEVGDVCEFLVEQFDRFPDSARIYHNQVSQSNDVTPSDIGGIERLQKLEGTFYVIVYPGVAAIPYIIYAVIAIASYFYAKSQVPSTSAMQRNVQQESPNNELSERTNRARPRARIPDIYGTVRSTPDLLTLPYSVYENHIETEYAYMCVGRGAFEISAGEVKDETTPISEIDGSGVEIYAPNTSPNSGDSPQLTVGNSVSEPLLAADRSNAVNGQILKAGNLTFAGDGDINLYVQSGDGVCELITGSTRNLTEYFNAGDQVTLVGSAFDFTGDYPNWQQSTGYLIGDIISDGVNGWICFANHTSGGGTFEDDRPLYWADYALTGTVDGTYVVVDVNTTVLSLDDPTSATVNWTKIENSPSGETGFHSPSLERVDSPQWVGPFLVRAENLSKVYTNFIAINGLFVDTGTAQTKIDVTVEIELTPTNASGVATGAVQTFQGVIAGSSVLRSSRAVTLKTTFGTGTTGYEGYYKIRARRVTPVITTPGSVVDEIKWRDLYSMGAVSENDFGNVTTIHSVSRATGGALVAKSRKLNMLVTRKLPQRVSGSTFTTELYATDRADDILSAICLDPYLGNRSTDEVDFDNIYNTVAEIETYFGIEKAVQFGYTFDADNISFEEMVSSVASAIFCTAYRFGSVIKLNFEKETDDSVLLFNHRNKLPGSEKRTVRFGRQSDFDSVRVEYVNPEDDSVATVYLPDDTGKNPKRIETVGVRNRIQAYWIAQRYWGRIQYQNVATEFEATQEADLLALNDRILVADNTRSGTQDGEVVSQNGLELTLSQPVTFADGVNYTIFLQHTDGTTEALSITAGSDSYKVILGSAPRAALSLDPANYARATYQIVGDNDSREQAFLVTEKESMDTLNSRLTAINYDARYYEADEYYKNGTINEEAEVNLAGDVSFSPAADATLLFPSSFPLSVTINKTNPSAVVRYSKTSMPAAITDGTEYTTPVAMNDGETLYARAFTSLGVGTGQSATYSITRYNLDFQYEENSQYLGAL